jgi:uncharacterized repeat protein (TIGR03803 family)
MWSMPDSNPTIYGAHPYAGLINVKSTLYGTTIGGCAKDHGTVFAITTSGKERVLYSFKDYYDGDGALPLAGLTNLKGTLYGTTEVGGTGSGSNYDHGTIFAVTRSGTETVLHSFGGPGDGYWPHAGLINVKGRLYGTTELGAGKYYGTVFSLKP